MFLAHVRLNGAEQTVRVNGAEIRPLRGQEDAFEVCVYDHRTEAQIGWVPVAQLSPEDRARLYGSRRDHQLLSQGWKEFTPREKLWTVDEMTGGYARVHVD